MLHHPEFGGPHNQALRLASPLRERGWEMHVALPEDARDAAARLDAGGVHVVRIPLGRVRASAKPDLIFRTLTGFAGDVARIRRLSRELKIDLLLFCGLVNVQSALAARLEGLPLVWQLVDTRTPRLVRSFGMPLARMCGDVVMSTGRMVAAQHPGTSRLGSRLVPFFPPVDTRLFKASADERARARASLGIDDRVPLIGNVSNLNPQKGHLTFVRAAAEVRREFPSSRFVILGATYAHHAEHMAAILSEATRLGLEPGRDIIITDPRDQVPRLSQAFDVFWMTSEPNSEGIPTVVEEAMALELPVVTADVGGVRELVDDGISGFVVSPRDALAFARATRILLNDQALRKKMGALARDTVIQKADLDACAGDHILAFERARLYHEGLTNTYA